MPRRKSEVQSVIFYKRLWKKADAAKWLKDHDFDSKKVDSTRNTWRFRQHEPTKYKRFAMKPVREKGILFVIGFH
jgi:hypothetical protein